MGDAQTPAEAAWQKLAQLSADPQTRENPPAMDLILEEDYESDLIDACKAAVAAGGSLRSTALFSDSLRCPPTSFRPCWGT